MNILKIKNTQTGEWQKQLPRFNGTYLTKEEYEKAIAELESVEE